MGNVHRDRLSDALPYGISLLGALILLLAAFNSVLQ